MSAEDTRLGLGSSKSPRRLGLVALLALACARPPTVRPARPALDTGRLDAEVFTLDRFARRTLWSWTGGATAAALADGPPLLRVRIHLHPPDSSFYDVHVRASSDAALRELLTHAPFDRTRYAWSNPWGAALGLDEERYGDRLVRVELRADAVVARFVPRTAEGGPAPFGLPEWAFQTVDGTPVSREAVLADPARLAAVVHVRAAWSGGTFVGYREVVLIQEGALARYELGTPAVRAGLDAALDLLRGLSGRVPDERADDPAFLTRLVEGTWPAGGAPDVEARWFLTLPFPRPAYRDLPALTRALVHARYAQRRPVSWTTD